MRRIKGLLKPVARHNISRIFPTCILALALLAPSPAPPQEQPDLDALAATAATQIHKSLKSHGNKILVIDFADPQAKASGVGVLLADRFADSLRKNTQGLVVLDRADYARATAEDILTPEARADEQSARCYCRQLGADFAVEGMIDSSAGQLQLKLRVTRLTDWKRIFDGTASLPLRSELRADLSTPAVPSPIPPGSNKNTWTNPDAPLSTVDAAAARTPSSTKASLPTCVYCPNAQFSDAAVYAKVQGTIFLDLLIDAAGRPANISVTRGLPCGLNSRAIEAVKQWRFNPARDPNGNPTPARQVVEITLHLY
jgi:TonB family protein